MEFVFRNHLISNRDIFTTYLYVHSTARIRDLETLSFILLFTQTLKLLIKYPKMINAPLLPAMLAPFSEFFSKIEFFHFDSNL